jgi:hypothetical protein
MKKDIKEYVGEKFIYKNQIWLCTGYEGCDMFDFVSEVTNEKITIPYTWGKFIMCNIENEIKDIHDWIIENKDNLEIFSWNNNTRMKVAMNVHDLYLSVIFKKDTESNIFKNYYDIDTINDVKTNGRYKKYSKDIEKIWNILMNIDNEQRQSLEGKKIREEIDKLVNCNDYDKEFEFGEPNHKENLPDFDLEVGKTYLVPMKLLEKERCFDSGRGTEYYKFHYTTGTYGYRPFAIPDYHMTKEIRKIEEEKS